MKRQYTAGLPETAEGRMRRSRVQLLMKFPEVGKASLPLNLVEDSSITSVATDGESLFYNSNWAMAEKTESVNGAIAHVVLHIMLDHYGMDNADEAVAEEINKVVEKNYRLRSTFGDQYPVKVQLVDPHTKWDKEKMKRPLILQPATWDGDPKELLDEGKLPTELVHANFSQVMDFCGKVVQEMHSDPSPNMNRIGNLLKFMLGGIIQREINTLLIRDIVCSENVRTQVLSHPLWVEWSLENKDYIM